MKTTYNHKVSTIASWFASYEWYISTAIDYFLKGVLKP